MIKNRSAVKTEWVKWKLKRLDCQNGLKPEWMNGGIGRMHNRPVFSAVRCCERVCKTAFVSPPPTYHTGLVSCCKTANFGPLGPPLRSLVVAVTKLWMARSNSEGFFDQIYCRPWALRGVPTSLLFSISKRKMLVCHSSVWKLCVIKLCPSCPMCTCLTLRLWIYDQI